MDTEAQDDAALVTRVLEGDKSAFGFLIDRHRPVATKLARRLFGDLADAEDVVQEAFLQAFLGLHHLRAPDRFLIWLLGIVVNLCRMRLRARNDGKFREDTSGERVITNSTWVDTEPSAEVSYETRELHQIVLTAIATLSTEQQQAVRLYYLDGLTLWEIGVLAGMPVGTVKSHLHRARTQLRLELTREFSDKRGPHPRTKEEASS